MSTVTISKLKKFDNLGKRTIDIDGEEVTRTVYADPNTGVEYIRHKGMAIEVPADIPDTEAIPIASVAPELNEVSKGPNRLTICALGMTINQLRDKLESTLGLSTDDGCKINGSPADGGYVICENDIIRFEKVAGTKGC